MVGACHGGIREIGGCPERGDRRKGGCRVVSVLTDCRLCPPEADTPITSYRGHPAANVKAVFIEETLGLVVLCAHV